MSQVSSWWLRNHCGLDLELRLNIKELWADSHKYWNYVFMHFTISDFKSTTIASFWITCFFKHIYSIYNKTGVTIKAWTRIFVVWSVSGWWFMVRVNFDNFRFRKKISYLIKVNFIIFSVNMIFLQTGNSQNKPSGTL